MTGINTTFRSWARTSLLYLVLISFLGLLLRFVFISPVPGVNYKYFLHAHSHAAFLGWIFNALFAAIVSDFIPSTHSGRRKYRILFILLQVSVIGMLVTFPIKGYYRDSIIFSTLHVLLSYLFACYIFKDGRQSPTRNSVSFLAIRISLVFMVISSLGPFALGFLMAKGLGSTPWYNLSIYYYLHFQYNGWFVFALLGLFFKLLENLGIAFQKKKATLFLGLLAFATVPAYALSALWVPPPSEVFAVGLTAGIMQLAAVGLFVYLGAPALQKLKGRVPELTRNLFMVSLFFFIVKMILQFISAFETTSQLAYQTRNFVIAYLHMIFLGFCTLFLIGWFVYKRWIAIDSGLAKTGLGLFIFSFLLSESIMVLQPSLIILKIAHLSNYVHWIFWATAGMAAGLTMMMIAIFFFKKQKFYPDSH